jgi:putative SOS response-associated peptidase YedK
MCGRYVSPDTAAIERAWQIGRRSGNPYPRRFNVAPTSQVQIVRRAVDADELELTEARWGLTPSWWSKDKAPTSTINARSEEAATKPMWRDAYRRSRCLIPALGWYEWKALETVDPKSGEIRTYKQPYYLRIDREGPMAFAGLMSTWTYEGEPRLTCAILTRPPSPSAAEVHDRMPVVLAEGAHREWLDPGLRDAGKVAQLVRDCAMDNVKHYPVSRRVSSGKEDDEGLIQPLEAQSV